MSLNCGVQEKSNSALTWVHCRTLLLSFNSITWPRYHGNVLEIGQKFEYLQLISAITKLMNGERLNIGCKFKSIMVCSVRLSAKAEQT